MAGFFAAPLALAAFHLLHPTEPPPTPQPILPATLSAALDRAVYWPDHTLRPADLARALERACAAEEVLACLLIAGSVRAAPLAPIDALCADGELDACTYAIWRRRQRVPRSVTRARARQACRLGAGRACVFWAAHLAADDPGRGRLTAERACADGELSGCLLRATLEPAPIIQAARLAAICSDGDARGCQLLARLSGPDGAYPDPPQQALAWWRGCALGDQAVCPAARDAWPLWVSR